ALNARLAFNPNTNTLILVPTVPLAGGSYLFTLSHMKAQNGDPLTNPGGRLPIYSGFTVRANAARPQAAIKIDWETPLSRPVVAHVASSTHQSEPNIATKRFTLSLPRGLPRHRPTQSVRL